MPATQPQPNKTYDLPYIVFIPRNRYGIKSGYYDNRALRALLIVKKDDPDAIEYIAGLLE